jgi:hypothetical protein
VKSANPECCFCSSGALKTYDNLWEGGNQEIPIQGSMSGEEHGFPAR